MLPDNLDNKIKEIFDKHSPHPDESSWKKMELLLNKHLPQKKKDRRRILFILLFFLVLGGGIFSVFFMNKNDNNKKSFGDASIKNEKKLEDSNNSPVEKKTQATTPLNIQDVEDQISAITTNDVSENNIPVEFKNQDNKYQTPVNLTGNKQQILIETKKNNTVKKSKPSPKKTSVEKVEPENIIAKNEPAKKVETELKSTMQTVVADSEIVNPASAIKSETDISALTKNDPIKDQSADVSVEKQDISSPVDEDEKKDSANLIPDKTSKSEKKKNPLENLFISFSTGADISMIGFSYNGKLKPITGVGIGYNISPRLSIRTGFYTGSKIYQAKPGDYHPPKEFWNYYPNLKTIDADCKVYEVPLNVDYNFSPDRKFQWFVSTGLSSLFMKKEVYEYYFKPTYSQQFVTYTRTHENENKHIFSVLNLSGGLNTNLNKTFTLRAEPYYKIALGGVGYGKIKLNSAGILVSAIVRPFK